MRHLPALPAPFTDCVALVAVEPDTRCMPLKALLGDNTAIERGVDGILQKWGPGDRLAAASLWSYGYFSRLLRPFFAYGVLTERWLDIRPHQVATELSSMATVSRFVVPGTIEFEPALASMNEHVELIVDECCKRTGTKERLHRSNAEFVFWRSMHLLSAAGAGSGKDELLQAVRESILARRPRFASTVAYDDRSPPVRRVCCLRDRLSALARCQAACPLSMPRRTRSRSCEHQGATCSSR
ncbi:hypothetical protein [Ensifer canadensis]